MRRGHGGHSNRYLNLYDNITLQRQAGLVYEILKSPGHLYGKRTLCFWQKYGKLFSAHAGQNINITQGRLTNFRQHFEHMVANLVSIAIIDPLEVIYVQHEDGELLPLRLARRSSCSALSMK